MWQARCCCGSCFWGAAWSRCQCTEWLSRVVGKQWTAHMVRQHVALWEAGEFSDSVFLVSVLQVLLGAFGAYASNSSWHTLGHISHGSRPTGVSSRQFSLLPTVDWVMNLVTCVTQYACYLMKVYWTVGGHLYAFSCKTTDVQLVKLGNG